MAKNSGKFKRYVMSYSFQGRKAREIAHYKQRIKELKSMENDEIDLEYINLTTEYEYKKKWFDNIYHFHCNSSFDEFVEIFLYVYGESHTICCFK